MSLMGSDYIRQMNDERIHNVFYPRQPPSNRTPAAKQDANGCVAAIALIAMCAACFWFGMWLGSHQPAAKVPVEAAP